MGIRMNPPEFPEQRRQDPKRRAEARVFDALQRLDLEGYGLYEYRFRKEGKAGRQPPLGARARAVRRPGQGRDV